MSGSIEAFASRAPPNSTCPILEESVAVHWAGITNEFSSQVQDAGEILGRLDLVDGTLLADEDQAALAGFVP